MKGEPMEGETLTHALDALDYMEGYVEVSAGKDGLARLAVARRVLRRQALLLARCKGVLSAAEYVTPTAEALIAGIVAMLPELETSRLGVLDAAQEERPVPGPTPKLAEDTVL